MADGAPRAGLTRCKVPGVRCQQKTGWHLAPGTWHLLIRGDPSAGRVSAIGQKYSGYWQPEPSPRKKSIS